VGGEAGLSGVSGLSGLGGVFGLSGLGGVLGLLGEFGLSTLWTLTWLCTESTLSGEATLAVSAPRLRASWTVVGTVLDVELVVTDVTEVAASSRIGSGLFEFPPSLATAIPATPSAEIAAREVTTFQLRGLLD